MSLQGAQVDVFKNLPTVPTGDSADLHMISQKSK